MTFKVLTIVGTRPELIRLSCLIPKLDKVFDHTLVHTSQNYDPNLNNIFFTDFDLRLPDHTFSLEPNASQSQHIAQIISQTDDLINSLEPDAFLILGDTNSAYSSIAAKKRKVPIFHFEAGNRCFDSIVPEEVNRQIIDKVADINVTYTQLARQNLLLEGFHPSRVHCLGSPMNEVIISNRQNIQSSSVLETLSLNENDYFVLSCHRQENVDNPKRLQKLLQLITYILDYTHKKIVFSVHPRTAEKLKALDFKFPPELVLLPPFSFSDYVHLQSKSIAVLSDSGTLTEESLIVGFPAFNIRFNQERPEGLDHGYPPLIDLSTNSFEYAFKALLLDNNGSNPQRAIPEEYMVSDFSNRVINLIISQTPYVNRYVWREDII